MTEAQARDVCTWRYPPPWDVYDMGPWDLVVEKGWGLADADARAREMLSVVDDDGALIGHVRLSRHEGRWMLGIGMRPDRCGRGFGAVVARLALEEHRRRRPDEPLRLEVRDWNVRAIRCYERAGFEIVDRVERTTGIGPGTFVVMRMRDEESGAPVGRLPSPTWPLPLS